MLLKFQEFLRQTDGVWLVVSSRAIFDCNVQTHVHSKSIEETGFRQDMGGSVIRIFILEGCPVLGCRWW